MKNNKHLFYSAVVKKLSFLSSHMLCPSHFCPFSLNSEETMDIAESAAIYRVKC
jgi:hypothetical protein